MPPTTRKPIGGSFGGVKPSSTTGLVTPRSMRPATTRPRGSSVTTTTLPFCGMCHSPRSPSTTMLAGASPRVISSTELAGGAAGPSATPGETSTEVTSTCAEGVAAQDAHASTQREGRMRFTQHP